MKTIKSSIEWTDFTLNLWTAKHEEVKTWRSKLAKIARLAPFWMQCNTCGARGEGLICQCAGTYEKSNPRVFCQSLSDTFEGPDTMGGKHSENWWSVSTRREQLGAAIDDHPNITFQVLTKRPENILKYGPLGMRWTQDGVPSNVWLGTSVEDQQTADERIPHLLNIPCETLFLSVEPMLGPVNLAGMGYCLTCKNGARVFGEGGYSPCPFCDDNDGCLLDGISWVVCGGESGPNARPMHPDWVRSIRDQCKYANVPFFFKQWGEWVSRSGLNEKGAGLEWADLSGKQTFQFINPEGLNHKTPYTPAYKVGKSKAGRLLDSCTWDQFPGGQSE